MCPKCESNERIRNAVTQIGGDSIRYTEVWSGRLNGVKRWFNMSLAKELLSRVLLGRPARDVPREYLFDVDVAEVWRDQISSCEIVADHLDHVDMSDPPIVGMTPHPTLVDTYNLHVMDGIHRFARAHRDGLRTLRVIRLSPEATSEIEIDPYEACLEEIMTELLGTGAEIRITPAGPCIVGGRVPRFDPSNDHPIKEKIIQTIASGPAMFTLNGADA